MESLTQFSSWRDVFATAAGELAASAADVLPRLFGALVILAVSWLLARVSEFVVRGGLRRLGFDSASSRVKMTDVLDRAGLGMTPSEAIGRLTFWTVLLSLLVATADSLGFSAVSATADRFVAYVPHLIGAALTLLIGLLLARFVGALFGSAAAAAGFPSAPRLGFFAHAAVAGLVAVVAIEQLGVSSAVLIGPLTALLATAGFATGLAFALGARPIVTHILAGHFLKQSLPRDTFVEVSGERGVVDHVGPTETVLRSGDRSWSVPNGRLIGEVVVR